MGSIIWIDMVIYSLVYKTSTCETQCGPLFWMNFWSCLTFAFYDWYSCHLIVSVNIKITAVFSIFKSNTLEPSTRAPWFQLVITSASISFKEGGVSPANNLPLLYFLRPAKRASFIYIFIYLYILSISWTSWYHTLLLPLRFITICMGNFNTNINISSTIW